MRLTAATTAIVLDSTSDFPEAPTRFPNWRVVPLHVRFGGESFRDYVELSPAQFYARLRTAAELPTTSQPSPGDFVAAYEELAGYERVLSVHVSGRLSGTVEGARAAAAGRDAVRVIDSGTASAAIAMQALGVQRLLEAGTTDEEVDAYVARFKREVGLLFTVNTLEFLARGGRIGRAKAAAGSLLQVKPILTVTDGEVVPVGRAHGSRKALAELAAEFDAPHGGGQRPARRLRPRGRARARGRAPRARAEGEAGGEDRGRDDARRRGRHARRAGHRRAVLALRRLTRFLDFWACPRGRSPPGSPDPRRPSSGRPAVRGRGPTRCCSPSSRSPASAPAWRRSSASSASTPSATWRGTRRATTSGRWPTG